MIISDISYILNEKKKKKKKKEQLFNEIMEEKKLSLLAINFVYVCVFFVFLSEVPQNRILSCFAVSQKNLHLSVIKNLHIFARGFKCP